MITLLRQRMHEDLQLAGLMESTQKSYLREVRQLARHFHKAPDQLTENQIRQYFLYLKNEKRHAPGTMKVAASAIIFFYRHTAPRDWEALKMLRIPRPKTLPDVLTIDEVRRLIDAVRKPHFRVFFWTAYSLGLRLREGLNLRVGDIDAKRMLVHVHLGKGAKDRYVPLPTSTLTILRQHWTTHRDQVWLFPPTRPGDRQVPSSPLPMARNCAQAAMRRVVAELGIRKDVTIHTLRHSYATHLLEAGVSLRLIQQYLGHASLQTTMIYLHLTSLGQERARAAIEKIMAE